jgi:hypothetical protein
MAALQYVRLILSLLYDHTKNSGQEVVEWRVVVVMDRNWQK